MDFGIVSLTDTKFSLILPSLRQWSSSVICFLRKLLFRPCSVFSISFLSPVSRLSPSSTVIIITVAFAHTTCSSLIPCPRAWCKFPAELFRFSSNKFMHRSLSLLGASFLLYRRGQTGRYLCAKYFFRFLRATQKNRKLSFRISPLFPSLPFSQNKNTYSRLNAKSYPTLASCT